MNINNPTTFGVPNLSLSTSNSSGTGGALRADDTILVYDTTVPTTIASGASAAAGDVATSARRNHTHGMFTITAQSSQGALEAETDEDTYAPPDRIKYSPGVAKVWCRWEQQGAHSIAASYNMASVTDGGGAGDTDLLYDVDFSSGDYTLAGNTHAALVVGTSGSPTAGGVTIHVWNSSDEVLTDASRVFLICAGEQV